MALAARLDGYREVLEERAATNVTISSYASADVVESGGSVIATKIDIHIHDLSAEAGFDEAVRRPLEHLAEGEPLLVIVDGLDESLSFGPRNLVELMSYVVRSPPPRLRFILTGRSGDVRILDLLGQPDLDLLRDVPSGCSDVADYVTDNLHWLPAATRRRLANRIAEASDENFLYAFHVTRDLVRHQDSIDDPSEIQLPQGLRGFYRDYLARELTRDRLDQGWRHQVRPVLSLLTIARGDGLTVRQIARAVPNLTGQELPAAQVVDALHACGQFLIWSGGDTPARIWHSSFQDFLTRDQDFAVFPEQANRALVESFLGQWAGHWDDCDEIYAFAHLPSHLMDVLRDTDDQELVQALPTMLTDLSFGRKKTAALGVDSFIADLRAAMALTPTLREAGLSELTEAVDRTAHELRLWDAAQAPGRFEQQLLLRAQHSGVGWLAEKCTERLKALGTLYVDARWWASMESPALERVMVGHQSDVEDLVLTGDETCAEAYS